MSNMRSFVFLLFACTLLFTVACKNEGGSSRSKVKDITADGYLISDYTNGSGLQRAEKKDQQNKIVEEGDLLNGKREGTWVTYHANSGLVATVTGYRNGQKHGVFLRGDETGGITEKAFYVNDQLEGKRIVYNRTRIKEEANYQNGKLEGERKLYYDNGKLQEEGTFKNGKRDGEAKWYDQEGNPTIQYKYKNGEQVN